MRLNYPRSEPSGVLTDFSAGKRLTTETRPMTLIDPRQMAIMKWLGPKDKSVTILRRRVAKQTIYAHAW
jgi:hypothetical protein